MSTLPRRSFFSATAVAAAVTAGGCARKPAPAAGYRVLTEGEVKTLDAWCEALIPRDQDPGASDAGVVRFIDIQLTRKYRKHLPVYRSALDAFARWTEPDATKKLTQMEKGKAPKQFFSDGGREAFELVLAHTMQGFYGSPRHGGNRDFVSWRMLGVPPLPVRGRQHYRIGEEARS
jgi:gluconate 2-dehydrogenase gamma chain